MNENILLGVIVCLSLALGWVCNNICDTVIFPPPIEVPFSGKESGLLPYDRVEQSQIHILPDRVVIDVEDVEWTRYTDTGSMEPVLGMGANGLEVIPKSESDVHVGDIVAYETDWYDGLIVHRIVKSGVDEEGTYYIMKGDNNFFTDPGKVRFSQIKCVLIAVVY
jgi:hypothetical protein